MQISPENPFGHTRYGFLWQFLRSRNSGRHLDYGAYDGAILKVLATTEVIRSGVGIEFNRDVVDRFSPSMPPNIELKHLLKGQDLPFPEASFDSASLLDVIEHISDQRRVLRDLHRVLKPGGSLVVTVPKQHVFSWLDTGNLKFRFPRMHRAFYTWWHSAEEYRLRYVDSPDGMIGDVEAEKRWHQHFRVQELAELLQSCGFEPVVADGSGLFTRPIAIVRDVSCQLLAPIANPLTRLDLSIGASKPASHRRFITGQR
jgi:SAM-dependent methyltransferase